MAAADGRSSLVRLVDRPDTQVMFVTAADQPEEISRAWARLETIVTSLRGRRFFGVIDAAVGTYRACVQVRDGDDAARLGLQSGVIPGGICGRGCVVNHRRSTSRSRPRTPRSSSQRSAIRPGPASSSTGAGTRSTC